MPRRNMQVMLVVVVVSIACYRSAHSAYRAMIDTFASVMTEIDARYVEPVDDRELFEGAMEGIVSKLDPYSAYVPPQDSQEFRQAIDQEFGGIGVEVEWDATNKHLVVLSPMVDSPAYEAGILAGDQIVSVDGEPLRATSLDQAVRELRGRAGELVRVGIRRAGHASDLEFELRRAVIHVDSVLGDDRSADGHWSFFVDPERRIGYVRLTTFGKDSAEELKRALGWLRERGAQGLILDLRNNAGGLLPVAIDTCDLFLKEGRIVTIRGRDRRPMAEFDASGEAPYTDLPMVVLVNRFSASASEIVAACLQDHGRATIIGERTWGKGTVQDVIDLEGGRSMLKLTTAKYYRPSEKNIHRDQNAGEEAEWGVRPDDGGLIPLDDEAFRQVLKERRRRDVTARSEWSAAGAGQLQRPNLSYDPQLERAVEVLSDKLAAPKAA